MQKSLEPRSGASALVAKNLTFSDALSHVKDFFKWLNGCLVSDWWLQSV